MKHIGISRYRVGLRTDYRGLRVGYHLIYWWGLRPRFYRNYYQYPHLH